MSFNDEELKHSDDEELEVSEEVEQTTDTVNSEESANSDQTAKQAKPKKEEKKSKKEEKKPSELEKAQAAADDYKRKWYSVSAEYDNYRKRNANAVSQAYADGKAEAILKLLPVSDTFGYAYDGATDEKTKTGIDKIIKNFNTILSSLGVEELQIKEGDAFDESLAEAIMNVPCEEGETPNTVKRVLKKGYKQGEKVIRFAQVMVTI
jgi:molecular chaperone GrpE